jgi:hypothetical protein
MKFFSVFFIALVLMSCGSSQLTNEDVEAHLLSESGVLNKVNLGDSWSDVQLLSGDYWSVTDDKSSNLYQFRKDLDLSNEVMIINFQVLNDKIVGIGTYILSKNIAQSALLIFQNDLTELYKNKFGIDLQNESSADMNFEGKSYHYSIISDVDSDNPTVQILCF